MDCEGYSNIAVTPGLSAGADFVQVTQDAEAEGGGNQPRRRETGRAVFALFHQDHLGGFRVGFAFQ